MNMLPSAQTNAFDRPTGPSLFSKSELANAQKKPRDHTPGQLYWQSRQHPFCTQIPTSAAQDRSNSIKGRA